VREVLQANQCPAFEVRTVAELARSPQYRARRFFTPMRDAALGAFAIPSTPFGGAKPRLRPAPRLGQHNAQVYGALGLRPAELRRLEAAGAI
jgi:crotonobetainyl-CoA:carnitine CoA-transferase CaiB-like acyl-CoA transferase